ncbi:MAG: AAA family ATPase [Leptospirales bacterium]|nr:AAA family ATPase [Leptospirales bacterium]
MTKIDLSKMHTYDIVLVCGLPGSGKSYLSQNEFNIQERKRISRKEIRRSVYEMTHFGEKWSEQFFSSADEPLVKHTERKMIEHLLSAGEKILIDNTNTSVDSRKNYAMIAAKMKKTIGVIFIDADISKCIMRNRASEDPVPENIIPKLAAGKTLPERREGFTSVVILPDSSVEAQ